MTMQTVTAYFDTSAEAARAVDAVVSAGVARDRVSTMAGPGATATPDDEKGFWASLGDMFGMDDDRHAYHEGMRRGGSIVAVRCDESDIDRVAGVLEKFGSVDLAGREETWRGEGWSGRATGLGDLGLGAVGAGALAGGGTTGLAMTGTDRGSVVPTTARATATEMATTPTAGDETLKVVEERLDVGKKAVQRGKVRIHSYVVETPVSEQVRLREETVSIQRQPVTGGTLGAMDADPFRERTIEMTETHEEAVIAKSVHVVEEIGIRKDVGERVQTVSDSVRSTKVDVEDTRTEAGMAASGIADSTGRVQKDMEVIGSDGAHVGTVDGLEGSSIKLKRMDPSADGQHHLIPIAWVASVTGRQVALSKSSADAKMSWKATG